MQIIADRKALHRIPELELCLPKTMSYLRSSLENLNCALFAPMDSCLCAWFDFGADSAIAFRADCDALPIQERGQTDYISIHPGVMHACGHDGHMAMLLELARRLNQKQTMPHNVLLVFQPGEESPGGAKPLCETGIFEKYGVEAIFGLHLWPGLPKGEIFSRKQELMSRSAEVNIQVRGKSAHIAKASLGRDALWAGTEVYRRAVAMEQALPPEIYRLLKFGFFTSGTVRNAISENTLIQGSLRAFQDAVFEALRDGLYEIARDVEAETGCTVNITMSQGYPAVMNPPELYDRVKAAVKFADIPEPSMTSEDFAWYQKFIPGIFFFLGVGDTPALHNDLFDFDMDVLTKGVDFLETLAETF